MDKELTLKKLNSTFSPRGKQDAPNSYAHPYETQILIGTIEILNQTEIGQMLVNFKGENEIRVRIMPDKMETGYIPSGKVAYVTAPVTQKHTTPRIVLNLVRALREAQQESMGYKRPKTNLPEQEFLDKGWEKEEDILFVMCSVAYELHKKTGLSDMIKEMNIMGFENTISGFIEDIETQ